MVRSYFEIPQFFIVENSKQRINVNIVTNVSFGNLVVTLVSSNNLPKIVRGGPAMRQWNFGKWYIFIKALENGFKHLSLYSSKAYRCSWELYDDLNQVKVYFGVKTFPVRDMKRCYLQKKMCATIRDFRETFSGY